MGCGASKSNRHSKDSPKNNTKKSNKTRKDDYNSSRLSTEEDILASTNNSFYSKGSVNTSRNSSIARSSGTGLSAREKLVYERPGSDDGERMDEPSAPMASMKRGWARVKATVLDHIKSQKDVETRREFELMMATFEPSKKLVKRCEYWLDDLEHPEPNPEFKDLELEERYHPLSIHDHSGGHSSRQNSICSSSSSTSQFAPAKECYLDHYLADIEENHALYDNESNGSLETGGASMRMASSMISSIRTLGSEASTGTGGGGGGRKMHGGILKRSPQTRPNAILVGNSVNGPQKSPTNNNSFESANAVLVSPQANQNGGVSPRAPFATNTNNNNNNNNNTLLSPHNAAIDDMDAMMFGAASSSNGKGGRSSSNNRTPRVAADGSCSDNDDGSRPNSSSQRKRHQPQQHGHQNNNATNGGSPGGRSPMNNLHHAQSWRPGQSVAPHVEVPAT